MSKFYCASRFCLTSFQTAVAVHVAAAAQAPSIDTLKKNDEEAAIKAAEKKEKEKEKKAERKKKKKEVSCF